MPPKKEVAGYIKLQIQAGAATLTPPVGPALGQHGVNITELYKVYNTATESQRGNVIPVEITVHEDRSFTFMTKTPPAAELIKKAAGVARDSLTPYSNRIGHLAAGQLREIAKTKEPDLNANDLDNAARIIAETTRPTGVTNDEIWSLPSACKRRERIAEGPARASWPQTAH